MSGDEQDTENSHCQSSICELSAAIPDGRRRGKLLTRVCVSLSVVHLQLNQVVLYPSCVPSDLLNVKMCALKPQ